MTLAFKMRAIPLCGGNTDRKTLQQSTGTGIPQANDATAVISSSHIFLFYVQRVMYYCRKVFSYVQIQQHMPLAYSINEQCSIICSTSKQPKQNKSFQAFTLFLNLNLIIYIKYQNVTTNNPIPLKVFTRLCNQITNQQQFH